MSQTAADKNEAAFSGRAAMRLLASLARPRLVGSRAEAEALALIEGELRDLGLNVTRQRFAFRPFYPMMWVKLILAALIIVLISLWAMAPDHQVAAGLLAPLPLVLLFTAMSAQRRLEARILETDVQGKHQLLSALFPSVGARLESENLVVTMRGEGSGPWSPHVLLMAHTDTKSQNISIVARIASVVGGLVFTLLLASLFATGAIKPEWAQGPYLRFAQSAALIIDLGFALAILGLSVQNESPGALDNAGSCVVLLETARVIAARPELVAGINLSMAFTGGEELGLAGSRALAREAGKYFRAAERLIVLNLDGIGGRGRPVITAEAGLVPTGKAEDVLDLVRSAAEDVGADPKVLKVVVGGEADHIPFLEAGVQAVSLGHFSREALAVHTDQDTIDKVDPARLEQAHKIILAALARLKPPAAAGSGDTEAACATMTISRAS